MRLETASWGASATFLHTPPTCLMQTEAEAEAKAADVRCKHLQKQLGEQRKALAAKEKAGSKLAKELERERAAVQAAEAAAAALGHDPAAVAALEAEAAAARGEVQRWRDRVDELAAQVAGALEDGRFQGWGCLFGFCCGGVARSMAALRACCAGPGGAPPGRPCCRSFPEAA